MNTPNTEVRSVRSAHSASRTLDGDGLEVRRAIPVQEYVRGRIGRIDICGSILAAGKGSTAVRVDGGSPDLHFCSD